MTTVLSYWDIEIQQTEIANVFKYNTFKYNSNDKKTYLVIDVLYYNAVTTI